MLTFLRRLCWSSLSLIALAAHAQSPLPAALEPWRGWALQGEAFRACPLIAGRPGKTADDFLCAWPGVLALNADAGGASVSQRWQVDADSWVPLPGDAEHWPQQVSVDGQPGVVVDRDGPALRLAAGSHEVRARIPWSARPQALRVPAAIGLVTLAVDGRAIAPVQRDGDELALGRAAAPQESDSLELRVYRRLADGVPAELTTAIELYASGQPREEVVGPVLPEGFVPLALDGDWPARLEADGRLRVRVQPGHDTLTLRARATAPLEQARVRLAPPPWPRQEIWSYQAAPQLRVTAASGAVQVDPRQAQVPANWQDLPAFALADAAVLAIEERSRGGAADARNRLTLDREMWLDFDGRGWFARDRLRGEMVQGWRFDAAAPFVLERADAGAGRGEEPLLVTRGAQPGSTGVEWRLPAVDLAAGLRVVPDGARLPIAGWRETFDQVTTTLHLPDGYKLLAAPGADSADGSWLSRWTLLDVFVAALLALLAWRWAGWAGTAVAVGYLLLGYQEPGAPLWTLFAAIALALVARALPAGRLQRAATWGGRAVLLLLALAALPFAAMQLRQALHPQLEDGGAYALQDVIGEFAAADKTAAPAEEAYAPAASPAPAPRSAEGAAQSQDALATAAVSGSRIRQADLMDRYDKSTVVQTGAGEPAWNLGHRYTLHWSGPVLPEQDVRFVIAAPWLVRLLRVLMVALLAWLIVRLLGPVRRAAAPSAAALAGLVAIASLGVHAPAQAQAFPPDELLAELRTRLTEAPKCAPACAAIARAELAARGEEIRVALEAHAAERVALPLPWDEKNLVLRGVLVDGAAQDGVARREGRLWLALPRGVHRVELAFAAAADKAMLAFPLAPMRVEFAGDGWEAAGLADGRLLTETLTLLRTPAATGAPPSAAGAQQFAPFVRVERTLSLGLDWTVRTQAQRLAPAAGGFTVSVPLLDGEHVASAGAKVENGRVTAAIADGAAQAEWTSTLDRAETLTLTAPPLGERAEVWRVVASPMWHVEFSGVPAVAAGADEDAHDYRSFAFHPLPGERLTLRVTRPEAVQGASRAIDAASLSHEVGQRAATSTLTLALRASQGGEQTVTLPPGAQTLAVSRDGEALNVRPQDGRLSLPYAPGRQTFQVQFRTPDAAGFVVRTPAVSLGVPAANIALALELPRDRWLLATGGPQTGPAVLYWSELAVMLVVAFALARTRRSPLKAWQWALLGLGFSTFSWGALLVVAAWLFALDARARRAPAAPRTFNLVQLGLVALTVAALACLAGSIQQGLLGTPDMHVAGYGSSAHALRWFADRSADALPAATAVSAPLWVYRLAMLAWALWLAAALVGWLRRGFAAWTQGGYWRSVPKPAAAVVDVPAAPPPPAAP